METRGCQYAKHWHFYPEVGSTFYQRSLGTLLINDFLYAFILFKNNYEVFPQC